MNWRGWFAFFLSGILDTGVDWRLLAGGATGKPAVILLTGGTTGKPVLALTQVMAGGSTMLISAARGVWRNNDANID